MVSLMRADKIRYKSLWAELRINTSQGDDRYADEINSARNILYNYTKPSTRNNKILKKLVF